MSVRALRIPLLMAVFISRASAQEPQRAPIDPSNSVRIVYGAANWNVDPQKIDSALIYMREGASGRLVQIRLEEDAPDSGVFTGLFSISWRNIDKLQTEFYVPPQALLTREHGFERISNMIAKNDLKRKPFILRKSADSVQTVEIYDSLEQAQNALKAYRAEAQLRATFGLKTQNYPSDQEVDVAKLASTSADRLNAAKAATERARQYQLEVGRLQAAQEAFLKLSPTVREQQKAKATTLAGDALAHFRANHFEEASRLFHDAMLLAPDTPGYAYQYAVTFYRLGDYNHSLVYLQLADDKSIQASERQYYIALNYLGLRDFDNAEASFNRVVASGDPTMSDSAQFYLGVVNFEMENWDKAQAAFQKVLDTGKDKALDAQAEAYIDQILRRRQFNEERARKWTLSATIGEMADSNVILSSISALDQGTASDSFGYRSLLMGSARYRPAYDEKQEFAVQADVLTIYTLDKSFAVDQTLRNADPTVVTLLAPYSIKSAIFGFGYKLDLAPGYETISMSLEDDTQKVIIDSVLFNVNNLVVMSPRWFANWNVETRKDSTHLAASTGDNDSNAYKFKLLNSNTFVLDEIRSKFATAEVGLTMNQAMGRNATYNRLDISGGYIRPAFWETIASAKLAYYLLTYPNHTSGRVDNNLTATVGLSKHVTAALSAGLTGSYNINSSNVDINSYRKWTLMLTMSAATSL